MTTTPHRPGPLDASAPPNPPAGPAAPGEAPGGPDERHPDAERRAAEMSTQDPWSPWSRDASSRRNDEGSPGHGPNDPSARPPGARSDGADEAQRSAETQRPAPTPSSGESSGAWWSTPWAGSEQSTQAGAGAGDATNPAGGSSPPTAAYGQPFPPGTPPGGAPPTGNSRPTPPWRSRRVAAATLALALVSAGIGGAVGAAVSDGNNNGNSISAGLTQNTSGGNSAISPAASGTVTSAANTILPSVVTIFEQSSSESGIGSGVIIRSDGYILTNNHVVSAASQGGTVKVTLQNGKTYPATIKGTDPSSDLAVIKINTTGLKPATIGNSNNLSIGDLVVAVGSPLGLSGTVTSGIVSSLHRPVSTGDSTQQQDQNAVLDAVQTDAPINPGNSGGALVNARGELVGINSAIATVASGSSNPSPFGGQQDQQSGNIGVGFAIPSSYAASIAGQLIATGTAKHPYIGVSASTAGDVNAQTGDGTGAEVQQLVDGGPAAKAGLTKGDIITKVDERTITSVNGLIAAVRSHNIGDTISITYLRDGQAHVVKVKLTQQQ
ncbi:MAG: trypsin-like peptidase domain-containing protein [Frankia sp.]